MPSRVTIWSRGWVGRPKTDQLKLLQLLPICTETMFPYWLVHMCSMMFNLVGFHTIRALEKSITLICLQKSSNFQLYFLCSLILLFTYLFMDKDYEETNPIVGTNALKMTMMIKITRSDGHI